MEVAIGIDTHKGSLAAAAVDALGRVLGVREFTNDPTGHRSLLRWVTEQGQPRTIGIEGSLSYGSAVAALLRWRKSWPDGPIRPGWYQITRASSANAAARRESGGTSVPRS